MSGAEELPSASFMTLLEDTYTRLTNSVRVRRRDYDWRVSQLRALKKMIEENEQKIFDALWKDLRKGPFECQATEQGVVVSEINDALKNLKSWMRPERVATPLYNWPGRSLIYREPLGLTLIIGAWNYPFQLTIAPLVGAIAGGNACIVKPPDMTPATAALISELVPQYLDRDLFAVLEGGKPENTEILKKKFDLIFFTGGTTVAKIVMTAAATHLTPVVLELGGKSPSVVLKDADIETTARRIAWGKFMNAGQTCIAPDYVLVERSVKQALVQELAKCVQSFYGSDVRSSKDYCRIVNTGAFDRLASLIEGSEVLHGGRFIRDELFMEPTLLSSSASSPAMQAEIFGPLLPLLEIDSADDAMEFVNQRPKPLALYLFTKDGRMKERFLHETTSGSFVVNDVVIHMPESELPFGGVGNSGIGAYHGKFSFETFTHAKGVLRKTTWFDVPVRYAPYTDMKSKVMRWLFS